MNSTKDSSKQLKAIFRTLPGSLKFPTVYKQSIFQAFIKESPTLKTSKSLCNLTSLQSKGWSLRFYKHLKECFPLPPSGSASILTALQPKVHASVRGENLEKQSLKEGKGIATEEQLEPSLKKLVLVSREVCQDPDEPIRVLYDIRGKIYQLTNDEIQAHLDKEEDIKKKAE
ncbi:hypothetical protein Tco_1168298 [Tanacetum coccineum]